MTAKFRFLTMCKMRTNQSVFAYRNNLWFMRYDIITDETDPARVMEYIRERIYKHAPYIEELRKAPNGWRYAVYEE